MFESFFHLSRVLSHTVLYISSVILYVSIQGGVRMIRTSTQVCVVDSPFTANLAPRHLYRYLLQVGVDVEFIFTPPYTCHQ